MSSSIKQDVKQGLAWSTIGKFVTQLFTWTSTFFVINILSPNDYGIIEICIALVSLSFVLSEGGLADAVVRYKDTSKQFSNEIFTTALLLNVAMYSIIWVTSPFVSAFFDEPALSTALRIIALQLPISSFFIVPLGRLRLIMNFKKIAIIEGITGVSNAAITLTCAVSGLAYWSLIYGVLGASIIKAFLLNYKSGDYYYLTTRFILLRKVARFSGLTVINRLLWLTYTKADVFIVGHFLSTVALGYYSVALQIAALPLIKVGAIINQVSFTAYAKISHDIKQVRYYFLLSSRTLAVISFPLFFGIAATAPTFVPLLLGDKWLASIRPLQILATIVPFRMLSLASQAMIQGMGKPEINTKSLLIAIITVPACMIVGANVDINYAALGWSLGYLIYAVFLAFRSIKLLEIEGVLYFTDVFIPLIFASIMFLGVIFIDLQYVYFGPFSKLLTQMIVGITIYVSLLFLLGKNRFVLPVLSIFKSKG